MIILNNKYLIVFFCLHITSVSYAQEFSAKLHWAKRVELGSPVSGVVEKVSVNVGDKVNSEDALVQLDSSVFQAHVNEYKAQLLSSQEALKEAERERDRALELYDRTVLSDHDLQIAKNKYKAAIARDKHVMANLIASQFNLKHSTIRAPFDAVVLQRYAQPGQVVATQFSQGPLIVVAASDKMIARFNIAEDMLTLIRKNKQASVVVDGETYHGKIISIGLELATGDVSSSGYPVEVEFSVERLLRAGRTAKVEMK